MRSTPAPSEQINLDAPRRERAVEELIDSVYSEPKGGETEQLVTL